MFLFHPGQGDKETFVNRASEAFREGSADKVEVLLATMVSLKLPENEETCAKAQATQILRDFFKKNPVQGFRITRQGGLEGGSWYLLGTLETRLTNYRLYLVIQQTAGKFEVREILIEMP